MSLPTRLTRKQLVAADEISALTRFNRSPATTGLHWSLHCLYVQMVESAKLYETKDRQNRRDSVANSLLAISHFLQNQGFPLASLQPIMRVIESLTERENGSIDPLFCDRVRTKGGAPKKSVASLQQMGTIGALANFWIAHHRDPDRNIKEQLSDIARLLKNKGLGEMSAARIKQARELVSQEDKEHPARSMANVVTQWLEEASSQFGEKEAFGIILHMIAGSPAVSGGFSEDQ